MLPIESQTASGDAVRAQKILCEEPDLKLAIIYGSAATGKMRADSDVDIALLFDRPLNTEKKMEIIARLERELKREVDLVDLFSLNGTILQQILTRGRLLVPGMPGVLTRLVQRMIYNQTDMMPYVTRTLLERQQRFVHG